MSTDYQSIMKEDLGNMIFPSEDVLNDKQEIILRMHHLNQALALGNLEKIKMKIYFADDRSQYEVNTTIWGITNKNIILKRGVTIPIHRILRIS